MSPTLIFLSVMFLAYSNGANDNFKGVATLFGSGVTNYKVSIWLAAITTFLGSIASIYLSLTLIKNFSANGLIPDNIAASPEFLLSVAAGAGLTVILASVAGFPISTTHSLTGALIGAGFMAVRLKIQVNILLNSFFIPLLFSPLIAIFAAGSLYAAFHYLRVYTKIKKDWCICAGETECMAPLLQPNSELAAIGIKTLDASVDSLENCKERYKGKVVGIEIQKLADLAHIFSAASVSFARGLNDTPKIAALLITVSAFDIKYGIGAVALFMAIGGLINAYKVAQTMSRRITPLNTGQGLTANLTTAILVLFASKLGMPVSTTHVAVGSIFGIGIINGSANNKMISSILYAWILTLPVSAILSGIFYLIL